MPHEISPFLGFREPVSSATHFVAFAWSFYAASIMWRLGRGNRRKQLAVAVFSATMIILYAASASYHAVSASPETIRIFQLCDLSAIYLLIAGTYTPALFVLLRDGRRKRLLLGGVWMLALAGIACKWLLPSEPYWMTVALYFGLGYSGLIPIMELKQAVGLRGLKWALGGGFMYMFGGLIDLFEWPIILRNVIGHHEIFHLCSMAGSFCHFVFMMLFVIPFPGYGNEVVVTSDSEHSRRGFMNAAIAETTGR